MLHDTDPRKIWLGSVTERLSTPTRQTQNRDIVASLFQMVATLFQHYNMCCAQIVVANRIVFSNSPLGYQWIENRGPCKNVIPFTGLIFFQINFPLPESYLLTQNSEIIMILCVCLRIYHYFSKKYINLAKKRQQRYLAVTLNAVRRAKCFFKKKLSKVLQS